MAGHNVAAAIAAQNARLDAMEATMAAQNASLRSQLTILRWLMGIGFTALLAAAVAQLFG